MPELWDFWVSAVVVVAAAGLLIVACKAWMFLEAIWCQREFDKQLADMRRELRAGQAIQAAHKRDIPARLDEWQRDKRHGDGSRSGKVQSF